MVEHSSFHMREDTLKWLEEVDKTWDLSNIENYEGEAIQ